MEPVTDKLVEELKAGGYTFWGFCWTRLRTLPEDEVAVWVKPIRNSSRWATRFLRGPKELANREREVSNTSPEFQGLFMYEDVARALDSVEGGAFRFHSLEQEVFEQIGTEALAQLTRGAGEIIRQKTATHPPHIIPYFNLFSGLIELREVGSTRFRVSPENPVRDLWAQYEAGMRDKEGKIREALKDHQSTLETMRQKFFGTALETL